MTKVKRVLFDTFALMAYVQDEVSSNIVERFLIDVEEDKIEGFISVISITEILYKVGIKNLELAYQLLAYIEESNLKIITLSYDLCRKAGELKLKYKNLDLSTADALILASGIHAEVNEVLSGDDEWIKIDELKIKEL